MAQCYRPAAFPTELSRLEFLGYGFALWLLDAHLAGPIDLHLTHWLTETFFPRAAAQLAPQTLRLTVVSPTARLEQLHTDAPVGEAVAQAFAAPHPYRVCTFVTEEAAVAWLLSEDGPPPRA